MSGDGSASAADSAPPETAAEAASYGVDVSDDAGGADGAEDLAAVAAELDRVIRDLGDHPDPRVREQVVDLMQLVDRLHRPALSALHAGLEAQGLLDEALGNPAIHAVLGLYELLGDEVAAAGVAEGTESAEGRDVPAGGLVQIGTPRFDDLVGLGELDDRRPSLVCHGDRDLVLVRLDGDVYGFDCQCPTCRVSLAEATVSSTILVCPMANCAFDVRSGRRVDGMDEGGLRVVPVAVRGGRVLLATTTVGPR